MLTYKHKILIDRTFGTAAVMILRFFTRLLGMLLKRDHSCPERPKTIVVAKIVGLGSIIYTTSLCRSLKERFPDTSSLSARVMGRRWPHIKEEHLYYFSPRSIRRALSRAGFVLERVGPYAKPTMISYMMSAARYSTSQFLYRALAIASGLLPGILKTAYFDVPMGEMFAVARKE